MEMSESFVVLWSQERVKRLRKAADDGPLEVIFGGPHISQPSIEKVRVGDKIFPIASAGGKLFLLAMLSVEEILDPEEFVSARFCVERRSALSWGEVFFSSDGRKFGHRIPQTCADLAARGTGTKFNWSRQISAGELEQLRFGPRVGKEMPAKGISGGLLKSSLSFQGHVRRTSRETGDLLNRLIYQGEV